MKFLPIKISASTTIIKNNEDKILLIKRSWSHKSYPFFWQLPEGKQKPGESNFDCAKRELYEETGIKCSLKHINKSILYINLLSFRIAYIHRSVFTGTVKSNRVKLSHEHSAYKWVKAKDTMKFRLVPGLKTILQG